MALKLGPNSNGISLPSDSDNTPKENNKKGLAITPAHKELSRKRETVNHPLHYGGKSNPTEVIKVVRSWGLGFSLGNVIKLIARSQTKKDEDKLEDLHKAMWYLQEEISHLYEKNIKMTDEKLDERS
jgi:hypothetical protein